MRFDGRLIESGHTVRVDVEGHLVGAVSPLDAAPDRWIAPGFIDVQVNGYFGHDINAPGVTSEDVVKLVHALWSRGVTAFCPTVITQSQEQMCHSLRAIAKARRSDPLIAHALPCIHVEGPYISAEDGPRGAHPLAHVRSPSLKEYRQWQDAAEGAIGIITLAPEQVGTQEYVRAVSIDGVVVSIGHTAATGEQIRMAVGAGARLSTHLGNGAHATITRHPNYIWEQLAEDCLYASLICDGHHLPPAVMKTMLRAKGVERSILISDAVAIAGLPPGVYKTAVGGKVELHPDGRLNLHGTPYLAGSTTSLPECIANVVRFADLSLRQAVCMASTNPAELLGLSERERRGSVRSGGMADLTLFRVDSGTGEVIVEATIVRGEQVYLRNR